MEKSEEMKNVVHLSKKSNDFFGGFDWFSTQKREQANARVDPVTGYQEAVEANQFSLLDLN